MSRLRLRITYANVTATLAMVFAMTGGAYAASKFLITSTKQIKPSVLAQLKGKAGAAGAAGAQGAAGPAGPQGPAGKDGANGANGKDGAAGASGESVTSGVLQAGEVGCPEGGSKFTVGGKITTACNGEKGEPGPVGPAGTTGFTKTLPADETETGTWSVSNPSIKDTSYSWTVPISFPIPLKAGIEQANFHVVKNCELESFSGTAKVECENEVKAAEKFCPGTVEHPKAIAGDLCVYQGAMTKSSEITELGPGSLVVNPGNNIEGFKTGTSAVGGVVFIAYGGPANEQSVSTFGTWAVTAPAS